MRSLRSKIMRAKYRIWKHLKKAFLGPVRYFIDFSTTADIQDPLLGSIVISRWTQLNFLNKRSLS